MWMFLTALSTIGLVYAKGVPPQNTSFVIQNHIGLNFDSATCIICENVMTIVQKQVGDEVDLKEDGLKLAITGACAYVTLGNPFTLGLCSALSTKLVSYMVDDVSERTFKVKPKSNCRTVGMCPPCKAPTGKFVLAKKPSLPLPWDTHNKHMHKQMVKKYTDDIAKKKKTMHIQHMRELALNPARQKTLLGDAKCYGCKSLLGILANDERINDAKQSGKSAVVEGVKSACKVYAKSYPFGSMLCDIMADKMVGGLADDLLKKTEIHPAETCRKIDMCPPCNGKCPDEDEFENTKKAADKGHTKIPDVDDSCVETPPPIAAKSCQDNYPDRCKKGEGSCDDSVYKRMMRMECVFTCICSWLPWGLGK
ncbi:hypothetical protein M3Y97_00181900 [Aphelenchoides bicaudatus]|nr:hypothetical protein M3Y97_00181900 [Aphelenchoides bicaudatus]